MTVSMDITPIKIFENQILAILRRKLSTASLVNAQQDAWGLRVVILTSRTK